MPTFNINMWFNCILRQNHISQFLKLGSEKTYACDLPDLAGSRARVSALNPIITASLQLSQRASSHQDHCHNNNVCFPDCYQENGKNYRGTVRKTRKGITCQKWNVNTPHRTKYADT